MMQSRKYFSNAKQPNTAVDGESAYVDVETISVRSPGEASVAAPALYPQLEIVPENGSDPMSAVGTGMTINGVCGAQNGTVRKARARDRYTIVPGRVLLFDSSGTGPTLQNDEMSADINEILQDFTPEMPARPRVQYTSENCSRSLPLETLRALDLLNTLAEIEEQLTCIGHKLEGYGGKLPTFTKSYELELAALSLRLCKKAAEDREQIAADAVAAANEASAAKGKGQIPEKSFDGPTRAEDDQKKEKEAGCCTNLGYFCMSI